MKDIKIDVDFEDTCIDFGKYVHDHCRVSFGQVEIDELWEQYQELMNKEVRDLLTDEGNGIGEPIMGSLEEVKRYNDYHTNTPERFPLSYEEWCLLDKDNGSESNATEKYKDTIKEAEPTQKEIEVNKYGELIKDFMEPYIEPNSKGNDTIGIANSELEDFYYSLGWRVRRWVKVAISREKDLVVDDDELVDDSDNVTYGNMGGIPREALNPNLITTFDKLDKMFDKPTQKETKPMKMTAEEFYKDHFGHTSQHVSMDKIFVCMELYVRHQKVVQEEFDSNHKFSTYDESKPISGNKYYCGHTTPCDCEPEIKQQ